VCLQAVHSLSVRVDSLDRRLVQLEATDVGNLQQRVTNVEQTLLTYHSDQSPTAAVNRPPSPSPRVETCDVDALLNQLNNLSARMTLAENQLMMQVFIYITGCTVAQHCCNDDQQSQWENGDFDPL